ncbi:MAG: hypothetical protein HUJ76_11330 [Parasporobacterium sp.]|nr:hypothetical protein [Parasporobacterium sp.]
MAIFVCKQCGGQLEVEPGQTILECEYCGCHMTVDEFYHDTDRKNAAEDSHPKPKKKKPDPDRDTAEKSKDKRNQEIYEKAAAVFGRLSHLSTDEALRELRESEYQFRCISGYLDAEEMADKCSRLWEIKMHEDDAEIVRTEHTKTVNKKHTEEVEPVSIFSFLLVLAIFIRVMAFVACGK